MPTQIHTSYHRDRLVTILASIGLVDCELQIVPSVQEWALAHGVAESDPLRCGMALRRRGDDRPTIVIADTISEDTQSGVVCALELRGFTEPLSELETPEGFLAHLLLHEAAHLILSTSATESTCDEWAFARLADAMRIMMCSESEIR